MHLFSWRVNGFFSHSETGNLTCINGTLWELRQMDIEGYRNAQTHFLLQFHAAITTKLFCVKCTLFNQKKGDWIDCHILYVAVIIGSLPLLVIYMYCFVQCSKLPFVLYFTLGNERKAYSANTICLLSAQPSFSVICPTLQVKGFNNLFCPNLYLSDCHCHHVIQHGLHLFWETTRVIANSVLAKTLEGGQRWSWYPQKVKLNASWGRGSAKAVLEIGPRRSCQLWFIKCSSCSDCW